jgi:glycosyltransferase involved in cell wall biosynthesis
MRASLLLVARDDAPAFLAQIEALVACDLPDDVEVVIVDDDAVPACSEIVDALAGDVVVLRNETAAGRHEALRRAAEASSASVCIALSPLARPLPGFVDGLVAALHGGAVLAAPTVQTGGGDVHGYRLAADGSLWPALAGAGAGAGTIASLDCLAARRRFFTDTMPAFDARDGHHETAVTAAAAELGRVAFVPEARVVRGSAGPPASVVICSANRVDEVLECVDLLVASGATADGGEVIVVDNGTDGTAATVEALALPGVRGVLEPVPGLSRARNVGAAAAHTGLVVYLDDDARPAPGWLESMRNAFTDPTIAVAGGPIHALWFGKDRMRFPPEYEGYFGIYDRGDAETRAPQAWHFGGNWAARSEVLAAIGGFDERLGASAHGRLPGEETAAAFRIAQRRLGRSRYAVGAAIGHRIDPTHVDDDWVLRRAYTSGLVELDALCHFLPPDRDAAEAAAGRAHLVVSAVVPTGCVDVPTGLAAIVAAPFPLPDRLLAGRALGLLVRSLEVAGLDGCPVGDSLFRFSPRNARGFIEPVEEALAA